MGMKTTTAALHKVFVGKGHVTHAAESPEWPGLTLCGKAWTDEGEDHFDITCEACSRIAGRPTGKSRASQGGTSARRQRSVR